MTWEQYRSQVYQHAIELKQGIEKHIAQFPGKPVQLSFLPNHMARTSPFFPMSRQEMKDRPDYKDFVVEVGQEKPATISDCGLAGVATVGQSDSFYEERHTNVSFVIK